MGGVDDAPVGVFDAAPLDRGDVFRSAEAPVVLANDLDPERRAFAVIAVTGDEANPGRTVAGTYGDLILSGDGARSCGPRVDATAHLGFGGRSGAISSPRPSRTRMAGRIPRSW